MGTRKARRSTSTPESIHQLKVSLRNVRPPVWRRLQVASDTSLGDLHVILQAAMGWEDYHLHLFSIGGETYADDRVEGGWDGPPHDEDLARMDQVTPVGARLRYEYDFGDRWEHDIVVEKVLPPEPTVTYPRCLAGRRACPPEDCGGPWGYANLLEAIADPKHPAHEELLEWVGAEFDPEALDTAAVNALLAHRSPRRT
ncbi:MAG: plasmid pRiA4b ORF-3 family protein [Actinomycetales bacterium]|nr:plasmid pRiA4b ORF-3 family protein [Actinomycetales bacterium]